LSISKNECEKNTRYRVRVTGRLVPPGDHATS
jgi:hypothetical protein